MVGLKIMIKHPISILPLGDSITDGYNYPGGYRIKLFELLKSAGIKVNYLGSMENGPLPEKKHEGHSGWTIEEINARIKYWLANINPGIILLLIGTNNIAMFDTAESAGNKLEMLLNNITRLKPESYLLTASIPPINDPHLNERIKSYNKRVKKLCDEHKEKNRKICFVDVFSGLNFDDLFDGAHPNKNGHDKIAYKWYEAALKIINMSKVVRR
jgi:acyl-CoA thioesterase-1